MASGYEALKNNTEGSDNTASGKGSIYSNTTGIENTAIGKNALYTNTTGSYNTAIGSYANVSSTNLSNATAIGYSASVSTSNTIQLGNTNVTDVKTSGTLTAGGLVLKTANIDQTNANNYNVTGIGILFINLGSGDMDINGFSGGVIGQVVQLVSTNNLNRNAFRLMHENSQGTQKFSNPINGPFTNLIVPGGITIVFDGTYWRPLNSSNF
jgi:hypothetical protein